MLDIEIIFLTHSTNTYLDPNTVQTYNSSYPYLCLSVLIVFECVDCVRVC